MSSLAFIFVLICLSILIFIFRYNLRNNVTQIDIYLLQLLLDCFFLQKPKKYFAISRIHVRSRTTGQRQSDGRILFREKPNGTIH